MRDPFRVEKRASRVPGALALAIYFCPYRARKPYNAVILSPFAVILSIDSLAAAHNRQKLGPRKGSAPVF